MNLLFASNNKGKVKEINEILSVSGLNILSLRDLGFTGDIIENGGTYYDNALIKVNAVYNQYKEKYPDAIYMADDSGIEIEALNGNPGIMSARWAGEGSTHDMLINKALSELEAIDTDNRSARFVCCIVIRYKDKIYQSSGETYGIISFEPSGTGGFGYDPIFLSKDYEYSMTIAELTEEEKNRISHRGRALENIKPVIMSLIEEAGNERKD